MYSYQASEGLKPFGEVIGHQEGSDVRFELAMSAVMVALNSNLLEGSVHPFNLAVGLRMTWFGQSALDAVRVTEHIERARQRAVGPRRFFDRSVNCMPLSASTVWIL
jgi:hypothetical protein